MESEEYPNTLPSFRSRTMDTFLGKAQNCRLMDRKDMAFLVGSVVVILIVVGLTIERLVTIIDKTSPDFTFAVILLINSGFCLSYVLMGVFFERPFELGAFILSTITVVAYIIVNYAVSSNRGPYKTTRLVVACVASPFLIMLGKDLLQLYHESKQLIFRTVGAHPSIQNICDNMFIFFSLLKGDLQLSVTGAVLILKTGYHMQLEDMILGPIVVLAGFSALCLGYLSARLESFRLMVACAVQWCLLTAYGIYLIGKSGWTICTVDVAGARMISAVTIVTASALLVIRVPLVIVGHRVCTNFGKGLKQKVFGMPDDELHHDIQAGGSEGQKHGSVSRIT